MAGDIDKKLADLGIALPEPAKPVASYVPFVQTGNLLFVSGQLPFGMDPMPAGTLTGDDHGGARVSEAAGAARVCGLNLLAQAKAALGGDLDRVVRVVKLVGFVNSDQTFTQQPVVVNGCSDLMVEVFGAKGEHARSAVGVSSLPLGVMVEIEAIFEVA